MKRLLFFFSALLLTTGNAIPVQSKPAQPEQSPTIAQSPTVREVVAACLSDHVETLPNPFRGVSPEGWAYTAVLKNYYCGVIRPSTPPDGVKRLTGIEVNPSALFHGD